MSRCVALFVGVLACSICAAGDDADLFGGRALVGGNGGLIDIYDRFFPAEVSPFVGCDDVAAVLDCLAFCTDGSVYEACSADQFLPTLAPSFTAKRFYSSVDVAGLRSLRAPYGADFVIVEKSDSILLVRPNVLREGSSVIAYNSIDTRRAGISDINAVKATAANGECFFAVEGDVLKKFKPFSGGNSVAEKNLRDLSVLADGDNVVALSAGLCSDESSIVYLMYTSNGDPHTIQFDMLLETPSFEEKTLMFEDGDVTGSSAHMRLEYLTGFDTLFALTPHAVVSGTARTVADMPQRVEVVGEVAYFLRLGGGFSAVCLDAPAHQAQAQFFPLEYPRLTEISNTLSAPSHSPRPAVFLVADPSGVTVFSLEQPREATPEIRISDGTLLWSAIATDAVVLAYTNELKTLRFNETLQNSEIVSTAVPSLTADSCTGHAVISYNTAVLVACWVSGAQTYPKGVIRALPMVFYKITPDGLEEVTAQVYWGTPSNSATAVKVGSHGVFSARGGGLNFTAWTDTYITTLDVTALTKDVQATPAELTMLSETDYLEKFEDYVANQAFPMDIAGKVTYNGVYLPGSDPALAEGVKEMLQGLKFVRFLSENATGGDVTEVVLIFEEETQSHIATVSFEAFRPAFGLHFAHIIDGTVRERCTLFVPQTKGIVEFIITQRVYGEREDEPTRPSGIIVESVQSAGLTLGEAPAYSALTAKWATLMDLHVHNSAKGLVYFLTFPSGVELVGAPADRVTSSPPTPAPETETPQEGSGGGATTEVPETVAPMSSGSGSGAETGTPKNTEVPIPPTEEPEGSGGGGVHVEPNADNKNNGFSVVLAIIAVVCLVCLCGVTICVRRVKKGAGGDSYEMVIMS